MSIEKTRVKRVPERGKYDRQSILAILDKSFLCHVGFVHDSYPVVIPTICANDNDYLYIHGATTSRMLMSIEDHDVSIAVSHVDGIVAARSAFHHSLNYRSVVLFGKAEKVYDDEEKLKVMEMITNHIIPGRWPECRPIKANELKATSILKIALDEASSKVRTGPPSDDLTDYELDIWAGVIPITQTLGQPIPDPKMKKGIAMSKAVEKLGTMTPFQS